jgi:molybdopterin synthase catalytic subunit
MSVEIHIFTGPLGGARALPVWDAGALLVFEGIVRPTEQEKTLAALEYQVYEPMTGRELRKLGEQITQAHHLLALRAEHSQGIVPAGQCSFRLQIASSHRGEGLAGMDEFLTRMKREVPIWKIPKWG